MQTALAARLAEVSSRLFGNELIRRIIRNSGYLFSAAGIAAFLGMLQSILAARLLGVTDFGILGTITMFTSVVNKFASFRMSELVVKYVGQYSVTGDDRRAAAVFKSAGIVETLTSVLAFGLIWLLAPLGARFFAKDINTSGWFLLYGVIVLANSMAESSTGLLQIFDKYRFIAGITIGQSLLTLGLISLAYTSQGGLFEIVLAYMVGKVSGAIALTAIALVVATRHWGHRWWFTPTSILRDDRRELARFALSTNVSATINLVNKDGELLWVSLLRNPTEAGYYKLALSLANLIQLPVAPLPQATYPELSREVAAKKWGNLRLILRQGSIFALVYSGAAALFLIIFGKPLVRIVYGAEFLPAYPALLILMAGLVVANTFYWNRIALLSLGLAGYPARVNLAAAALKITGVLTIVPRLGYLGSAALLSGFYLFSVTLNANKTRAELKAREGDSG